MDRHWVFKAVTRRIWSFQHTAVTLVAVGLEAVPALGVVEVRLRDDLVHRESTAAKDLAGVTVAAMYR